MKETREIIARIDYGFKDISQNWELPFGFVEPERNFKARDLLWIIPLGLLVLGIFSFATFFFWQFPEQLIIWVPIWILALLVGLII